MFLSIHGAYYIIYIYIIVYSIVVQGFHINRSRDGYWNRNEKDINIYLYIYIYMDMFAYV